MPKGVDDTGNRVASSKDLNSSSSLVTGITVEWGGDNPLIFANKVGYVNGTKSQTVFRNDLGLFTAIPEMEVDLNKQNGGIQDVPADIRMTIVSPFDIPANGDVSQPLWVTIYEWDPSSADQTVSILFRGRVGGMVINPNGLAGVIEFKVLGGKEGLSDVLVGIPALTTCPWTLGDKTCKVDLAALRETPDITNIVGKIVTVDALTTTTSRYWERGYMRFEKLRLGIRRYTGGLTFETYTAPPLILIGETIELTPGDDKTITTCRARFNNEQQFGGIGFAIPAYSPIFEDG